MDYLLAEDECAPDARDYFEEGFLRITGLLIGDFMERANKIGTSWKYNGFILEYFPDAPQYHLSKEKGPMAEQALTIIAGRKEFYKKD